MRRAVVTSTLVPTALVVLSLASTPLAAAPNLGSDIHRDGPLLRATRTDDAALSASAEVAAGVDTETNRDVGGQFDLGLSLLAGIRGAHTTWLALVSDTTLPLVVRPDASGETQSHLEMPEGHHRADARLTLVADDHDGFELRSAAQLTHGGEIARGIRDVEIGPGAWVTGEFRIGIVPRFLVFGGPMLLQFPVAYVARGTALVDGPSEAPRNQTFSDGWMQHGVDFGIVEVGVVPGDNGLVRGDFELLSGTYSVTELDSGTTAPARARIERFEARMVSADGVVVDLDEIYLTIDTVIGLATIMASDGMGGDIEATVARIGFGMRTTDGAGMHGGVGVERDGGFTADGSRVVGDTRLEFDIGITPEHMGGVVGASLESAFSWLDDARDDDLSDPRFRMALQTDVYAEPLEHLAVGLRYRVRRDLELAETTWDPWDAVGRWNHEVLGFVEYELEVSD